MRIGLVSLWFNRGQATVMRTIRQALDERGHETHVLARPTESTFERPSFIASDSVWAQDRVTHASNHTIPPAEYVEWATTTGIDCAIVFQNLDTVGLAALRSAGVAVIGTFMWEAFGPKEQAAVAPVVDRYFALNRPTAKWYRTLGVADVRDVPYCALPSLAAAARPRDIAGGVRFVYPGGYLRARKSVGPVVEAFVRGAPDDARLTVKAQRPLRTGDLVIADDSRQLAQRYDRHPEPIADLGPGDPRIDVVVGDEDEADFLDLLSHHDVIVGVSRWEGLGLHLFEAEALGLDLMLNRMEPYIDFAADRDHCFLADSRVIGKRPCGIDVHEPDVESLARLFALVGERRGRPLPEDHLERHAERWDRFGNAVDRLCAT
ncbi:MAG: hypothetical protein RIB98_05590 [Acidimicrobiales bacterium]